MGCALGKMIIDLRTLSVVSFERSSKIHAAIVGFGFVTYAATSVVDKVIDDKHVLDGKTVEIKLNRP